LGSSTLVSNCAGHGLKERCVVVFPRPRRAASWVCETLPSRVSESAYIAYATSRLQWLLLGAISSLDAPAGRPPNRESALRNRSLISWWPKGRGGSYLAPPSAVSAYIVGCNEPPCGSRFRSSLRDGSCVRVSCVACRGSIKCRRPIPRKPRARAREHDPQTVTHARTHTNRCAVVCGMRSISGHETSSDARPKIGRNESID